MSLNRALIFTSVNSAPDEILIVFKFAQSENTYAPSMVRPAGNVMLVRPLHL